MNEELQPKEEIKVSRAFAEKIKKQWEELAKRQASNHLTARSDKKITSVSFVRDHSGNIAVRIGLRNGRTINDNGREKRIDDFKKRSEQTYARIKVAELLKKIREYGYAAVEGEIPAELKDAVLRGMEKANISTSYKGAKAEDAERQVSLNAAKHEDNDPHPSLFAFDDRIAKQTGNNLIAPAKQGERPYRIKITPEIEQALAKGVAFILPPVSKAVNADVIPLIEKETEKTLSTAAGATGNTDLSAIKHNRIGSESVTAFTTDGRKITASAAELGSKDVVQQAYLRLLDRPRDEYTENDKKLEQFILRTLKHKGIVPKDAMEIPADKTNEAKEYISRNAAELPSKKAARFFPEDLKQQYQAAKIKERAFFEKELAEMQKGGLTAKRNDRQKIKAALAETPSLLSEIAGGKRESSDYSFNDIAQDLRNHEKSDDDRMMSRLLYLSLKNNPKMTQDSKIPQEYIQRTTQTLQKFKMRNAREPHMSFQKFLEQEGLLSQKKEARRIVPEKRPPSPESNRVTEKLRKTMHTHSSQSVRTTLPAEKRVVAKTETSERKSSALTPLHAILAKRKNDRAR